MQSLLDERHIFWMNDINSASKYDFHTEIARFFHNLNLPVRLCNRIPDVQQTESVVLIIALRGTVPSSDFGILPARIGNPDADSVTERTAGNMNLPFVSFLHLLRGFNGVA